MPNALKYDLPATKEIKGVEIFATGRWNGQTFNEADLDEMARAFEETGAQIVPPLKLGHDKVQDLAQKAGMPSIGWATRVYRQGSKLLADFSNMPAKVYELVKAGAYRKVSIELWRNMAVGKKVYPMMLKAVSLLGADTPAVQTLDDIIALYSAAGTAEGFDAEAAAETFEMEKNKSEEEPMPKNNEQLQAELDTKTTELSQALEKITKLEASAQEGETFKAKVAELTQAKETLEKTNGTLTAEVAELKGTVRKFSLETLRAQAKTKTQELLEGKKITPAQTGMVEASLFQALQTPEDQKFSVEDGKDEAGKEKTKDVNAFEFQVALFSKGTIGVNTEGASETGAPAQAEAQLDAVAKKIQEEYSAAGRQIPLKDAMIEAEKRIKGQQK